MVRGVWWRLATMLALVYGIQGAWYPLLSVHLDDLGYSGRARGLIFATMAIGSALAPLAVGRLADRRYAIERLLAVSYALGAGLLLAIAGFSRSGPSVLFALFLGYWILIAPSISLSTTLALRNLPNPAEQFGTVRAAGTAGWMAAGWVVGAWIGLGGDSSRATGAGPGFWLGAVMAAALSAFAWSGLPHTPPLSRTEGAATKPTRQGQSFEVLRGPGVVTYLVTAFGVALTLPYMYQTIPPYLVARGLGRSWVAAVMSLGQILEVAGLACLPVVLRRLGFRATLGMGIACWVLRYGQLALDPPLWQAVAGTLLHGLGIACFGVAGQMHLDRQAPARQRAEAQGLHTVVTSGVGVLLGSLMAGEAAAGSEGDGAIFRLPLIIAGASLVFWLIATRPRRAAAVGARIGAEGAEPTSFLA